MCDQLHDFLLYCLADDDFIDREKKVPFVTVNDQIGKFNAYTGR